MEEVNQLYDVMKYVVLSGVATTVATQILKHPSIPVPAKRYPVQTAAVVSLLASGFAFWQRCNEVSCSLLSWTDYVFAAVGTLIVATLTYNNVIQGRERVPETGTNEV